MNKKQALIVGALGGIGRNLNLFETFRQNKVIP